MKTISAAIPLLAIFPALAAVPAASAATCSPTSFVSAEAQELSQPAVFIGSDDVNGDGIADLITITRTFATVAIEVLVGNGDGTFQPSVSTPVGFVPTSFVTGDFNGDGKADVAIGSFAGGFLYLGVGDGTFQDPISFDVGVGGIALAAVHLDAGATLDLVEGGNGLEVLLGNGDGTFQPAVTYGAPGTITGLATGDFDGDGKVEVAATAGNLVSIYPGKGDGTLGSFVSTVAGIGAAFPRAADFDGDGKLDLVIASEGYAGVLMGRGDLSFEAARNYSSGPWVRAAAVVDLDGDGHPDLVAATGHEGDAGSPSALAVFRNLGDGTFSDGPIYAAYGGPDMPAIADFNGDGKPDVALAPKAATYLNLGDGQLAAARVVGPANLQALAAADFDGDGFLDVVIGTSGSSLVIARGNPDGSFTVPPGGGSPPPLVILAVAAIADFNGDGWLDVVGVTETFSHQLAYFAGNGDGTFQPAVLYDIPGSGFTTTSLVVADFNGDGHTDAAFADSNTFGGTGQVTVFLGDGHGAFTLTAAMAVSSGLSGGLAVADFDSDAIPDIAAGGGPPLGGGETLYFFHGRDDGTFDLPTTAPLPATPYSLTAGPFRTPDVNDLVIGFGSGPTPQTALYPGSADGTFGAPRTIAPFYGARTAAGDFDGDGLLDVVISDFLENEIVVRNLGGGSFGPPEVSPDSGAFGPILVADVDGNGTPDVLIGSSPLGISVLKNARLGAALYALRSLVGTRSLWFAHASGFGPLTYHWRKGGVPLTDGGTISGSQTPTLTIDPVSFPDAGSYDVIVTDSCGQTTSNSATLSVEFADVPVSSPFHDDILTIATAGITSGCGGGNYCPSSPVRRDQMAVFLLKSEHGSSYVPPTCTGLFADVPCPSAFADWIEQLSAEGVTSGCGNGNYCPASSVTRAQMAVFLLKTKNGSGYAPPPAVGLFGDVPVGSFAADFIEALYNQGITGGCQASPLLYCPGNAVLRQQMATFLVRTFGL